MMKPRKEYIPVGPNPRGRGGNEQRRRLGRIVKRSDRIGPLVLIGVLVVCCAGKLLLAAGGFAALMGFLSGRFVLLGAGVGVGIAGLGLWFRLRHRRHNLVSPHDLSERNTAEWEDAYAPQ